MSVDNIYSGFIQSLKFFEKNGFRFNDSVTMKVIVMNNDDPDIPCFFSNIEGDGSDSVKIYLANVLGELGGIFSIITFEQKSLKIWTDINISFKKHDAEFTQKYIEDLNTKIIGQLHVINDSAFHFAKFDYAYFTSMDSIVTCFGDTMLSAYSVKDTSVLHLR